MNSMTCYVYRCSAKPDMYIYIEEKDNFDRVPGKLLQSLGRRDFAMELELTAERKLAREDPQKVMTNLRDQGFHLQMPSDESIDEVMARIARESTQDVNE